MAAPGNLFTRIIISAEDRASKVFGAVLNKWTALSAALGVAIGAKGLTDATKKAMDFEAALDLIQSKTGASAEEMKRFEAAALKAGSETAYTATEAAQALSILGAAGLSAADSITTLPSVLSLAAAEGIGLEQAAGLVTDSVTVMGLAFADSARATDVMVQAANLSSVSAVQMGESLKYAGASAKSAGLSIEQTAAVLDVLASSGLRGEQAGTALRSILGQLSDPAGEARRELAALGIVTGDLNTVIDGIKAAGPQAGAAVRAFGVESGPAMQALISGGSAAINDYTAQLQNAGGAAKTAAGVMSDNLTGAFSGLSSAWDTLGIALTKPLLEPIKNQIVELTEKFRAAASDGSLTQFSTILVNGFNAAVTAVKTFAASFDFSALSARLTAFVSEAQGLFGNLSDTVTVAANTFKTVWLAVEQSVALVGSGLATVFQGVLEGLAWVTSGLEKIGLVSAGTAETLKTHAGAMGAAAAAMKQEAIDSYNAMLEAGGKVADATGRIIERTAQVGAAAVEAARVAVPAVHAHAAALTEAEIKLRDLIVAEEAAAAAIAASAAAEQTKQAALQATLNDLKILSNEYANLLAQGDQQAAAGILNQIRGIQSNLRAAGEQAGKTSAAVSDAFESLGIQSQATLNQLAANARANFETIRNAGTSAPEDIQAAFVAYAEKAIAANNGVADSAIRAAAAQQGLQVQAGATGDKVVQSGEASSDVYERLTSRIDQQTVANRDANQAFWDNKYAQDAAAEASKNLEKQNGAALEFFKWMGALIGEATDKLGAYSEAAATAVTNVLASTHTLADALKGMREIDIGGMIDNPALAKSVQELAALEAGIDAARQRTRDLEAASRDLFNIFRHVDAEMAVMAQMEERLARAAAQAKRMEIATDEMAGAMEDLARQFAQGDLGLADYIQNLEQVRGHYAKLGDERLSGLRAAIADAKAQMADFAASAKDGLVSLQQEWAELNGQQDESQRLQYQQDKLALETQIAQARADGNQTAVAALVQQSALLNKINRKKLDNIVAAEREAKAEEQTRRSEEARAKAAPITTSAAPNAAASTTTATPPGTAPVRTVNINLTAPGGAKSTVRVLDGDDDILARFFRDLETGRATAQ